MSSLTSPAHSDFGLLRILGFFKTQLYTLHCMLSLNVDHFIVYVLYPQPVTAGKRRIYGILILVLVYHLFFYYIIFLFTSKKS